MESMPSLTLFPCFLPKVQNTTTKRGKHKNIFYLILETDTNHPFHVTPKSSKNSMCGHEAETVIDDKVIRISLPIATLCGVLYKTKLQLASRVF
jgi:hypothetical protein